MSFELNKFLALTALLAGGAVVAAGCSSTDSKPANEDSNGSAGVGGAAAGKGNTPGDSGAAGETQTETQGGAAGAGIGQAGDGGASEGGAAGAPPVASCIADIVGAGG